MLLLTQLAYTRPFISNGGSSGCQKWQKLSELHSSISDSSCDLLHHLHQECLPDNKSSLHIHMFLHPPLGPQLDQLPGLSHHIIYTWNRQLPATSHHPHHCIVYESIFFLHTVHWTDFACTPFPQDRATFQSLALLINLQIMIHNLSILFNAQDSAVRT